MPELPEVETVRRELAPVLLHRKLTSIDVRLPKMVRSPLGRLHAAIRGATVVSLQRRAKLLCLGLSTGWTLVCHLKMSGQLIWQSNRGMRRGGGHPIPDALGHLPNRYSHLVFHFNGGTLFFNDLRQFGFVRLVRTKAIAAWIAQQGIGPEVLDPGFTLDVFAERLRTRSRSRLKSALLDQHFLAGLGNIYADESLYAAQLRPTRRIASLTRVERQRLYQAIRSVLHRALRYGGTTFRFFRRPSGQPGGMTRYLRVYGRDGQRCYRCGATIVKIRVQQRGAHYCPGCQR